MCPDLTSPNPEPSAVAALKKAIEGLTMPSESDEPFQVFNWAQVEQNLDAEKIATLAQVKNSTPVEERSLEDLFGELAVEEDWMEDEEKKAAQQFKELRAVLEKELTGVKAYLFGERKKDLVIVGKVEQGLAGTKTVVVET